MDELLSGEDQLTALKRVADLATQYECNLRITGAGADVATLEAVDTPTASQIVHPVKDAGYDIWKWTKKGHRLAETKVSAERAAQIVASEYLTAKAMRIRKRRPDLSLKLIFETLVKGYQGTVPVRITLPPQCESGGAECRR